MKKLLISLVCMFAVLPMLAQTYGSYDFASQKRVVWGLRAGINVGSINYDDVSSKVGFVGGLSSEIRLTADAGANAFGINTGLFFTQKGCRESDSSLKGRITLNCIDLPVYLSYKYHFSDAVNLQFFFGPYIDYGVYGKATVETKGSSKVSASVDIFDEEDFNRFMVGYGTGVELTYKKFAFGFTFQSDLTDACGSESGKWQNFMITIGTNF